MYLKRNDTVVVISGEQKGSTGKVLRVLRDRGQVVVQGLNLRYKHIRRSQKYPQGGRIQKESPMPISKVLLVDPKTGKPTRVGFRFVDGKKVRYAKKSGEPI
jgi:large subunit ribosomal protein L24